jgi:hypothetical protein
MDKSGPPNYKIWLTRELENSMEPSKVESLLLRLKGIFATYWVDFGVTPTSGDDIRINGEEIYLIEGRVFKVEGSIYQLHITVGAYPSMSEATEGSSSITSR